IPHGGGGPGMGPSCVNEKLAPYLPGHIMEKEAGKAANGISTGADVHGTCAMSAAPFGSASLLLISYAYIKMLGSEGITRATKYAILNANYMKARLEKYFKILYAGSHGCWEH